MQRILLMITESTRLRTDVLTQIPALVSVHRRDRASFDTAWDPCYRPGSALDRGLVDGAPGRVAVSPNPVHAEVMERATHLPATRLPATRLISVALARSLRGETRRSTSRRLVVLSDALALAFWRSFLASPRWRAEQREGDTDNGGPEADL